MEERILLVEDDMALAMGTQYALEAEGYEVIHASTISKAREYVSQKPDLVLLDVMLPDGTGYDLCKEIRESGNNVPIIFLTAVAEEVNVVQGLMIGADDYVAKPYRLKELLSRIAANIRRYKLSRNSAAEEESFVFGTHRFYQKEFRLLKENQVVDCTSSELRLLNELIVHGGQVLTRTQLLGRLYDTENTFIDDNTLSVYMKRLRDKLEEDAKYIETVRGVGYRFRKEL